MLTLLAALTIAQWPQVQCLSSGGQTACANTPWGRCVSTSGRVFCGDPAPEVLRLVADPPPVQCLTSAGTGACGYDCKASAGHVACARTPWGRCVTTHGQVFCADPSNVALWVGEGLEPVECVTTNGTAACGYDCKTTGGQAACAETPWGRCVTTAGRIFCGDPAPWAFRRGVAPPPVQCVTTSGVGACGYDCKTSSGRAACSGSPWGRCVTSAGVITCSR